MEIRTEQLRLIPATAELLRLELSDLEAFAARLNAALPEDWPPGEYDRDAIEYFLERTMDGGEAVVGWYGWYLLLNRKEGGSVLAGCGGYLGPPDEAGRVEIGYSISKRWRGQGLAHEVVGWLLANAWRRGVQTVQAHAHPDNSASIAVLSASGFHPVPEEHSKTLLFAISHSRRC